MRRTDRHQLRLAPIALAPALLAFGFAVLLPLALTLGYSLTEWDGYGAMEFVGAGNYLRALGDPVFRDSFLHVLGYIGATLVLEVAVGLGLAGVAAARRGGLWFRVAIFTPVMLPMVVVAVLWSFVYDPDFGLVNATLGALGLTGLQRIWLGDTSTALLAVSDGTIRAAAGGSRDDDRDQVRTGRRGRRIGIERRARAGTPPDDQRDDCPWEGGKQPGRHVSKLATCA